MRTKFGVLIPAFKPPERPIPITIEFVLTGAIPSHKNRQRASFNYSWAIGQIKKFFRSQTPADITVKACMSFVVKLIKNIRPFIYKPDDIVKWEQAAIDTITKQANENRITYARHRLRYPITHCSISILHYWADEYQRDNSNREQTIHDLLVTAGIIADDNYKCLFRNVSEAACFKDVLTDHVTTINITAYHW